MTKLDWETDCGTTEELTAPKKAQEKLACLKLRPAEGKPFLAAFVDG